MAKKAKILVIGPGFPYRNGQSIYLTHLCTQLQSDFEVSLVNYSMLYPSFLFPGKTQYDESKDKQLHFPNQRMINSLNPFNWYKVAKHINKEDPDLIAIDWWHPFLGLCHRGITMFLNKKLRKKIVFITENVISHEANKMDKILTRMGLKYASCFLALSNSVEQYLNTMFHKKVFRSVLPIYDFYKSEDETFVQKNADLKAGLGFSEEDTVFLFFGLVRKYKGLDILISAFAELKKQYKNIKLLAIGEFYEDAAPYFDLIKDLNLSNDVRLENKYVPNEDVQQYFDVSDCLVLPYRSATQSGILSMAYGFGKPVVVTNVGELGALVREGKTGYVVAQANVEDVAKGMEQYLTNKNQEPYLQNIQQYLKETDTFTKVNAEFDKIIDFVNK